MSDMEFGKNAYNNREYLPTHAGIDWEQAWQARHQNVVQLSVWGQSMDELGEFCEQLTQENTCFYLNDTDDDFDVMVIIDHRDEFGDFWWSRQQLGSDMFDTLLDEIGAEVMVVHTKYPSQRIAEYILKIMEVDVEEI